MRARHRLFPTLDAPKTLAPDRMTLAIVPSFSPTSPPITKAPLIRPPANDCEIVAVAVSAAALASDPDFLETPLGPLEGTEDVFFVYTDSRVPEISYGEDWDTLGQRSTASGSAKVANLRVPWTAVLGFEDKAFVPQPANSTPGLTSQTLMPVFYVSLARGALNRAVSYIKDHGRAWLHSPYDRAVDEPYVVDGIGELQSRLHAPPMVSCRPRVSAVIFIMGLPSVDIRMEPVVR